MNAKMILGEMALRYFGKIGLSFLAPLNFEKNEFEQGIGRNKYQSFELCSNCFKKLMYKN